MRIFLAGLVGASLALTGSAPAQDFAGTYQAVGKSGIPITLDIRQNHLGEVTGSLSTATITYQVQGTVTEGKVFGTMKSGSDVRFFEAILHRSVLSTTFYEVSATGGPDYLSGQNLLFQRQDDPQGDAVVGNVGRDRGLRTAFDMPRTLTGKLYLSRRLLIEALFQATALSTRPPVAGVVQSGTLTVDAEGSSYDAQPTDQLILRIAGQTHGFVLEEIRGNLLAEDAAEWLTSPHTLRYRYQVEGQNEIAISMQFDGVLFEAGLTGWYSDADVRFDIDLAATGQASGTLDRYGQQSWANFNLTGTLRGGGLEVNVQERHEGSIGGSTGILYPDPDRAGAVGRSRVTIANSVRRGEEVYGFHDVQLESEIRLATGTAEAALVSLTGSVFRGGQLFGDMVLQDGRALVRAGSETIILIGPPHNER